MFSMGYDSSRINNSNFELFSPVSTKESTGSEVKKDGARNYSSNLVLPPLTKLNSPRSSFSAHGSPPHVLVPWAGDKRAQTGGIISAKRRIHQKVVTTEEKCYSSNLTKGVNNTSSTRTCKLGARRETNSRERRTQMISLSDNSDSAMSLTENLPVEWEQRTTWSTTSNTTQKSGTAPSCRRASPKPFLYPVKPMTAGPCLPGIVRIEDYQHVALRNKTDLDLQKVYDTSYRPTMKFPKFNSATLTTFNPQFINNNCEQRKQDTVTSSGSRTSLIGSADQKSTVTNNHNGHQRKSVKKDRKKPKSNSSTWLSYKLSNSTWGLKKHRTIS